ncbi:PH domain-containing protein [Yinghuangia sp. ASG 101]|uniref:PH domain-containing protein n=1 Tax=Yinghuangia sp. ASG 101 TaxID=2896848 RepID=UPI001E2EB9EB|nr:PH domain-containing protein [Yinghuangia sp. ASG 101]UGQ11513.1 PH domain-containing protein [Yinghuangia sp. ASG 101]
MSVPGRAAAAEVLVPAERRARRVASDAGILLAIACLVLVLEIVAVFGAGALSADGVTTTLREPGIAGYLGLPGAVVVLGSPLLILSWRERPALRIDGVGISRVRRTRVETVPWSDVEAVRFSRRGRVLVVQMRAGSTLPDRRRGIAQHAVAVPFFLLGNPRRGRTRDRRALVVAALERLAPGKYNGRTGRPSTASER